MCIRPAQPERAHAGEAALLAGWKWPRLGGNHERRTRQIDSRVELAQVQMRWNDLVLQRQRGFDQSGNAGGRFGMAQIGLD